MPLKRLVEAHHGAPDWGLRVIGIHEEVQSGHRCVDCKYYRKLIRYGECQHPAHRWLLNPDVAKKRFPCPDWRKRK